MCCWNEHHNLFLPAPPTLWCLPLINEEAHKWVNECTFFKIILFVKSTFFYIWPLKVNFSLLSITNIFTQAQTIFPQDPFFPRPPVYPLGNRSKWLSQSFGPWLWWGPLSCSHKFAYDHYLIQFLFTKLLIKISTYKVLSGASLYQAFYFCSIFHASTIAFHTIKRDELRD